MKRTVIIKETHRGLWYEDGVVTRVLSAGRYQLPWNWKWRWWPGKTVEIVEVDIREQELTIKGQEILTADKVALRVSILVQFRVTDPRSALNKVANYPDRLYSDVQLAARRSLASMELEEILTNRNRLSEEILQEVTGSAGGYGVLVIRADVKDLVFPGNLQEIMNRVLAAERMSQVQLVEARTQAQIQQIEAEAKREVQQLAAEAERLAAENEARIQQIRTASEIQALQERERTAEAFSHHPALLRLIELETLRDLALNSNARIYVDFDRQTKSQDSQDPT